MKKISFWSLLLLITTLVFSCRKNEKLAEEPTTATATKTADNSLLSAKATTIEALAEQYIKTHPAEATNAQKIISVTNEFFAINGQTEQFRNKKPTRIQPIYAYGIDGIAYYEIWFTEDDRTPQGWILISATDKDYPLVNFSHGIPYSSHMLTTTNQDNKVYRFGVSYFSMEKDGQKIAEYGKMPTFIGNANTHVEGNGVEDSKDPNSARKSNVEAKEGVDFFPITGYESLKQLYAQNYYSSNRSVSALEMKRRIFPVTGHGEAVRSQANKTTAQYNYRWVSGATAYYTQIPAYTSSNNFPCWSGCQNNAWASIYAWWDRNRSKTALIPTTSTGETSPLYRNTAARQNVVDPVQMYIRAVSGTYRGSGTGWTLWSNAYKGYMYASAKGYGYAYKYYWCNSAGCNVDLANIVTEGIANNYTPVHIGANSHFYVGLGWSQWSDNTDWTWAYCYPGWSENDNDNVWIWWHDFNTATRLYVY